MNLNVDGNDTFVYTGGRRPDSDRPAVVFLHGAGMDHSIWTLQARYLAHHGRQVWCPDLPAHGRSGGQALTRIEDMAGWLERFLDAAGIETASLVGHSMGTLIALAFAAHRPHRTRRLVLLGTSVPMPVSEGLLAAAKADDPRAWDMIIQWGHAYASQLGGHTVPGLWMTGQARRLLARSRPGVLYHDLNACNAYQAGLEQAARITCPTLLILGSRDLMAPPKVARPLLEALTDGRQVVLEGSGHMLFNERPDQVLDVLRDILGA